MKQATIAAISTPFGNGGIGIIRISGHRSIEIASRLFTPSRQGLPVDSQGQDTAFKSHLFYHGHIRDPQSLQRIDEVLFVAMPAPKSYTREDVVEIHSHSGSVVLSRIFEAVVSEGAVVAAPGEFTRRAFLNGRIDLTQAEAVIDVINAKSDTALTIANRQLAGGMAEKLAPIRNALQSKRVLLEARIDFPEDVDGGGEMDSILADLDGVVIDPIESLLNSYRSDHFFRDGVKMAIIGRPNVGKSSLMNRLVNSDRAIVTPVPGTTRDVIEATFHIRGLPVVIMDTAGLRDACGEIEKIGVQRTRQTIKDADIILFITDAREVTSTEDEKIFQLIQGKNTLIVRNKCDLIATATPPLPELWQNTPSILVSALKGTKIGALQKKIATLLVGENAPDREIGIVPNLRHKKELEDCKVAVQRAQRAAGHGLPEEMIAADIMAALGHLDIILGRNHHDPDLLDHIFNRFCIGK